MTNIPISIPCNERRSWCDWKSRQTDTERKYWKKKKKLSCNHNHQWIVRQENSIGVRKILKKVWQTTLYSQKNTPIENLETQDGYLPNKVNRWILKDKLRKDVIGYQQQKDLNKGRERICVRVPYQNSFSSIRLNNIQTFKEKDNYLY